MAKWLLISRQEALQRNGQDPSLERLPVFYMNDYTRLGLRVASCDDARQVLMENRFGVSQDDEGFHVALENAAEVENAVALLNSRGVVCEIADLAEGIYQG